jgi:thiosulfate/3-mercaptopyruvate sulfurtransferase
MALPRLPLIVEPEDLEAFLEHPDVLILDLRNPDDYERAHIPGAISVQYAEFVAAEPPAMGLLPSVGKLTEVLSTLGIGPRTHVVTYDDEGGGRAARVIWTLHALDHESCSLLNGGFQAWFNENHPHNSALVQRIPTDYVVELKNPSVIARTEYVHSQLASPKTVLLDTRTSDEFYGIDLRAARGGHIPGAVNRNWTDNLDPSRNLRLLPDDSLRIALRQLDVIPDHEVIVYCQTHHRSSHTYVMLKHLGFPKVRGYPGAWSQWGNDLHLPIEI